VRFYVVHAVWKVTVEVKIIVGAEFHLPFLAGQLPILVLIAHVELPVSSFRADKLVWADDAIPIKIVGVEQGIIAVLCKPFCAGQFSVTISVSAVEFECSTLGLDEFCCTDGTISIEIVGVKHGHALFTEAILFSPFFSRKPTVFILVTFIELPLGIPSSDPLLGSDGAIVVAICAERQP
jgi:hypothetical protein